MSVSDKFLVISLNKNDLDILKDIGVLVSSYFELSITMTSNNTNFNLLADTDGKSLEDMGNIRAFASGIYEYKKWCRIFHEE